MKNTYIKLLGCLTTFALLTGCVSVCNSPSRGTQVYRIVCRLTGESNNLEIFIATGSTSQPIVTMADNNGYPRIVDFYARPAESRGKDGIHVTIRFDAPARGQELAINVLQEGMKGMGVSQ